VTWHQFGHIHSLLLNDLRVPVKIAQEQLGHPRSGITASSQRVDRFALGAPGLRGSTAGRRSYSFIESAVITSATAASSQDAGGISTNAAVAGRAAPSAKQAYAREEPAVVTNVIV
jgi:hypothetical protein